jgi:cytochrome P450
MQDLFASGTDTSTISVEWTMAELLWHPAVMAKVRAELRDTLGSKPHPDESDIDRLPYLRAISNPWITNEIPLAQRQQENTRGRPTTSKPQPTEPKT